MKSNHFRNGTNLFLVLISTCFCALIIVLLSGFYIYMRVLAIKAEMIDMPLDEENIGRFAGHAVANLILLVPILYCGAAFARFCLRAAPPRLSGRVRFGAPLLFFLPALAYALLAVKFLLNFLTSSEPLHGDRSQTINTATFGALFLIWFGAFAIIQLKRHLKPLFFLDRPYVLFLRSFSKFSDRTVISLVLRQAAVGRPVVFLVPIRSRAADWNPFLVGFAGMRLLHPFRSVPVIVKTPNAEWEEAIQLLIRRAQTVVLDISENTNSIQTEVEMIDGAECWQKTILLKAASAKAGDEREQHIAPKDTRIIHYRKSWIRAIPRLMFGYFVISLATVPVFLLNVGPIDNPAVRILCLLLGILLFGWLYVSFFVRPSIDRKSKRSLKQILLVARNVTLPEAANNNTSSRRHDQTLTSHG